MGYYLCFLLLIHACCAEMPYWYWYATKEEISSFENGRLPTLACPVSWCSSRTLFVRMSFASYLQVVSFSQIGTYRDFNLGVGQAGCIPCPPGRYGSSIHLADSMCTAACPRGTYLGARLIKTHASLFTRQLTNVFDQIRQVGHQ